LMVRGVRVGTGTHAVTATPFTMSA
jgi:hypothetical protein